jgi:hypothetical protein
MSYIEYVVSDYGSEDPLPELARANRFTMDDLAQNRKGRISDKQMGHLFFMALYPIRYPAMALLGWLTCCFIVKTLVPDFVLMIAALFGMKSIGVLFGAITLACLGSLFVALLRGSRNLFLLVRDLSAGKAEFLDGRVTVSREESGGLGMDQFRNEKRMQTWYVVLNHYFEVPEAAAEALPHNMRLRLYFTPRSKLLLSIEPVPAT